MKKDTKSRIRTILELYLTEPMDEKEIALELDISYNYVHKIVSDYNEFIERKYCELN